jgi:hypothetical protein
MLKGEDQLTKRLYVHTTTTAITNTATKLLQGLLQLSLLVWLKVLRRKGRQKGTSAIFLERITVST